MLEFGLELSFSRTYTYKNFSFLLYLLACGGRCCLRWRTCRRGKSVCSWIIQMLGNHYCIFCLRGNNVSGTVFSMLIALMQNQCTFWSLIARLNEKRLDFFNYRLGHFILQILSLCWFSKKEHTTPWGIWISCIEDLLMTSKRVSVIMSVLMHCEFYLINSKYY